MTRDFYIFLPDDRILTNYEMDVVKFIYIARIWIFTIPVLLEHIQSQTALTRKQFLLPCLSGSSQSSQICGNKIHFISRSWFQLSISAPGPAVICLEMCLSFSLVSVLYFEENLDCWQAVFSLRVT